MKKEEILRMSREENSKGYDERELAAYGAASRIGLSIGGMVCVALVLISEFVLNNSILSIVGWMVYLSMFGTQKLVLYKHLRKKSNLVFGIINTVIAILSLVMLIVKG